MPSLTIWFRHPGVAAAHLCNGDNLSRASLTPQRR